MNESGAKAWFYALNDRQTGPVTGAELRQLQRDNVIGPLTLVWSSHLSGWTQLVAVPASLLPPAPGPLSPAPPALPPAVQAAVSAPLPSEPRAYQLEFRGRAGEYFGIWIVNLVLTVVTLGIYAAWAKVRNRRYFFGNTLLDGVPFDFTGSPIAILKGNLIFGSLFILSAFTSSFIAVNLAVTLVFAMLIPWLIQRALRFRARNTIYRGVRFNHRGTAAESYAVYFWLPIGAVFTLGFLFPYVIYRQKRFSLGNFGWGNQSADALFQTGHIYAIWLKAFGLAMILLLLIGTALALTLPALLSDPGAGAGTRFASPISTVVPGAAAASPEPHTARGHADDDEEPMDPRERLRHLTHDRAFMIGQIVGQGVVLVLFLFVQLYFTTRITNYTLGCTQWGSLGRIESTLRARDIFWLRLSNAIAILLSLGLLIPWAKIRMARYRTSRTRFLATGNLNDVAQAAVADISAIGDSAADVFDIDIGF